jgi:hypothetical protein
MAANRENLVRRNNTICEPDAVLNNSESGKYINYCVLKGYVEVRSHAFFPYLIIMKNLDAPMLTRVWQELEYRIDVCRVTRRAHIEHL